MYATTPALTWPNAPAARATTGLDAARSVGWATLGAGLFSLAYLSGRLSGDVAPVMQLVLLRYAGGSILLIGLALARRDLSASLRTRRPGAHLTRSLCSCAGGFAAIYTATHLPATSASAIGLLDGVLIVLLGAAVFGERLPRVRAVAIALCVAGAAVVVVGNGGSGIGPSAASAFPMVVGLAGAALVAIETVLIKSLGRSERTLTILLWVNLCGVLVFAGPGVIGWRPVPPALIAGFLALGPLTLLAQTANIRALRLAEAGVVGPVRYVGIVFAAAIAWFAFGEPLTPVGALGCAIVLGGAALLASGSRPRTP